MNKYLSLSLVLAGAVAACSDSSDEIVRPPEGFQLVWSDEFDGAAGSAPDVSTWAYDIGTGPNGDGWGNAQLEFNTDQTTNVALDGNGNLAIIAREQSFAGSAYTSGRIKTEGNFAQQYGRIEARIKLPVGSGIWPAFWMLGDDFAEVGWPQTGEIDIMEYRGQRPGTVIGSIHGPGFSGGDSISAQFSLEEGGFDDDFHVFAVEWDPSRIAWFVDDEVYNVVTAGDVVIGQNREWVFDHPFFIILNVAVGGTFVGPVGADTVFPQTMLVDYVRVFSRVP